jgi:hypothetical protein
LAKSGPTGSTPLALLPQDVHKLEWLARLAPEQLEELLSRIDVKRAGRNEVIAEVKAILGTGEKSAGRNDPFGSLTRGFDRLRKAVRKFAVDMGDADGKARLEQAVLTGVHQRRRPSSHILRLPQSGKAAIGPAPPRGRNCAGEDSLHAPAAAGPREGHQGHQGHQHQGW